MKLKKKIALLLAVIASLAFVLPIMGEEDGAETHLNSGQTYSTSAWTTSGYSQGFGEGKNESDNSVSLVRMKIRMCTYPQTYQIVWNNTLGGPIQGGGSAVTGYTYPAGNSTSNYCVSLTLEQGSVYYAWGRVYYKEAVNKSIPVSVTE